MAADVTDLVAVLKQQRDDTWDRCIKASSRARTWYRWSVALAVLAALGSGAAGATVAAGTLSSTGRAVVAVLAFAGAVLSGISAAVGAPGQAKAEQVKSDQLASLVRWADVELVTMPGLDRKSAQVRIRDFLVWRDDIQGVAAPQAVRSATPVEPTPDPDQPPNPPGAGLAPTKGAPPKDDAPGRDDGQTGVDPTKTSTANKKPKSPTAKGRSVIAPSAPPTTAGANETEPAA